MTVLSKAVEFAESIHGKDKKNQAPFLYHPLAVASLVLKYGGSSDQMVAALIHDTISYEGVSEKKISDLFGEKIADLTYAFFDPPLPKTADWRMTKQAYLDKVRALPEEKLLVVACEELHELLELTHDLKYLGVRVWERYPVHAMEIGWYFKELLAIFYQKLKEKTALVSEFGRGVKALTDIVYEAKG